jgi:hypothetical protein
MDSSTITGLVKPDLQVLNERLGGITLGSSL